MHWLFGNSIIDNSKRTALTHYFSPTPSETIGGVIGNYLNTEPANKKMVEDLAKQIIQLYNSQAYMYADNGDAYKINARLAILAHMTNIVPAFNCKSGKDRTGMLDAEIKHMATRIHLENTVPAIEETMDDTTRNNLIQWICLAGNHEMQAYNTGAKGFKVDKQLTQLRLQDTEAVSYICGLGGQVKA